MKSFRIHTIIIILILLQANFTQKAVEAFPSTRLSSPAGYCSYLYLLNVQAYPDNRPFAGWDRGLDLIPGGHLAAEQINNNSNILPDTRSLQMLHAEYVLCRALVIVGQELQHTVLPIHTIPLNFIAFLL